jgi:hypothetical protein
MAWNKQDLFQGIRRESRLNASFAALPWLSMRLQDAEPFPCAVVMIISFIITSQPVNS